MIREALHHSLRAAVREPVVTICSIVLLTLGISSFSAGTAVVRSIVLDPTPFSDEPDLVRWWGSPLHSRLRMGLSGVEATALAEVPGIVAAGAFASHRSTAKAPNGSEAQVTAASVTAGVFAALATKPVAGRSFTAEEDQRGGPLVCLVHEGVWRRFFPGEVFAPGQSLEVDGIDRLIVGVLPANFSFPQPRVEIWIPLRSGHLAPMLEQDGGGAFGLIARHEPDVETTVLASRAAAVVSGLNAHRSTNDQRQAWAEGLDEVYLNPVRKPIRVLSIAVGLVLLSALANLTILQLARGSKLARESAIRLALGETRQGTLVRALLDGVIPCLVAVVLALPVSNTILQLVQQASALGWLTLDVDGWSILAGALLGAVAIAVASFTSRRGARAPMNVLRSGSLVYLAPWRWIATLQLALSFVALTGALYFFGTWTTLSRVDPGFDPQDLHVLEVRLPVERFPLVPADPATWANNHQILREIQREIREFGGLPKSAIGMVHPITPGWTIPYQVPGRPPDPELRQIRLRVVGDQYFETAGIALLAGRTFTAADKHESMPVAILNQAAARSFFATSDPLGKTVSAWYGERRVVGVVADTHFLGIELDRQPAIFTPMRQSPAGFAFVTVKSQLAPDLLRRKVSESVARVDSGLVVSQPESLADLTFGPLDTARIGSGLAIAAALSVVSLAVVGLYGLISASALAWRREMALRLCLGAESAQVLWLVLRRVGLIAAVGLSVGLGAVLVVQTLFADLVHTKAGPLELLIAASICLGCCLAATLGPAMSTVRLQPAIVLRSE